MSKDSSSPAPCMLSSPEDSRQMAPPVPQGLYPQVPPDGSPSSRRNTLAQVAPTSGQLATRRSTLMNSPAYVRAPAFRNGMRRHTTVMTLMSYLAKQGRTHTNSLSFRSSDVFQLKPDTALENTYQLGPTERFSADKVSDLIKHVLKEQLHGEEYYPGIMAEQSKILADRIKDRIKIMALNRYKIVCWVTIGQKAAGDVRIASQALWDSNFDNYTQAFYENKSLFALGVVYAVYQE